MYKYACSKKIWKADKEHGDHMHDVVLPHYIYLWGRNLKIDTTNGGKLDRQFSIDVITTDMKHIKNHIQEKFQRFEKAHYKTVTIEYMSNVDYNIEGAFFHMNVDYYIMGYASEDNTDFEHLWVLPWNLLKYWISNHFTEDGLKKLLEYNYKHSRANFLAIPRKWIPDDLIVYEYHRKNTLMGFNGGNGGL